MLPRQLFNQTIISAGDLGGDVTGSVISVNEARDIAIQSVWTGSSPIGNIITQASCDGVNYTTVSGGSQAISGASGSLILNIPSIGFFFLRVIYTRTSGTGTLNVTVNAKR